MTGYGRATGNYEDKSILVEIRALNGKFTDVRLKLPHLYREKELELRRMLLEWIERGKIEVVIEAQSASGRDEYTLNYPLFEYHYRELSKIAESLGQSPGDMMTAVLRLPNVVAPESGSLTDGEWQALQDTAKAAFEKFNAFRQNEGKSLQKVFKKHVNRIQQLLEKVDPLDQQRAEQIRERLHKSLEDNMSRERIDENRFEQEVLFYLEKIDINEEKSRLGLHCTHFLEVMDNDIVRKGKKLNFISQEMGREINTLGAKAYSSEIQRLVVDMKNELEKIKEQLANTV